VNATEVQRGAPNVKSRIFVIEDHGLMRRSIVQALERESDLIVCGEAEDAEEALAAILSLQPDLVLTDIQLKSSSGLDLIKTLRTRSPGLPVIATTMFDVRRTERLARDAGASAFVAKQDGPDKLVAAIHDALADRDHDANP
jgi:two-component system, NarL family, response regulator FusR